MTVHSIERNTNVPKSRSRRKKKDDYTPPERHESTASGLGGGRWVVPTMVTLLVLGLVWIIIYYVAGQDIPVMSDLGGWNLLIGMGLITGGFVAATQWK